MPNSLFQISTENLPQPLAPTEQAFLDYLQETLAIINDYKKHDFAKLAEHIKKQLNELHQKKNAQNSEFMVAVHHVISPLVELRNLEKIQNQRQQLWDLLNTPAMESRLLTALEKKFGEQSVAIKKVKEITREAKNYGVFGDFTAVQLAVMTEMLSVVQKDILKLLAIHKNNLSFVFQDLCQKLLAAFKKACKQIAFCMAALIKADKDTYKEEFKKINFAELFPEEFSPDLVNSYIDVVDEPLKSSQVGENPLEKSWQKFSECQPYYNFDVMANLGKTLADETGISTFLVPARPDKSLRHLMPTHAFSNEEQDPQQQRCVYDFTVAFVEKYGPQKNNAKSQQIVKSSHNNSSSKIFIVTREIFKFLDHLINSPATSFSFAKKIYNKVQDVVFMNLHKSQKRLRYQQAIRPIQARHEARLLTDGRQQNVVNIKENNCSHHGSLLNSYVHISDMASIKPPPPPILNPSIKTLAQLQQEVPISSTHLPKVKKSITGKQIAKMVFFGVTSFVIISFIIGAIAASHGVAVLFLAPISKAILTGLTAKLGVTAGEILFYDLTSTATANCAVACADQMEPREKQANVATIPKPPVS